MACTRYSSEAHKLCSRQVLSGKDSGFPSLDSYVTQMSHSFTQQWIDRHWLGLGLGLD